jgi:FKBP-type peptidyl-prolyl cis-trans isomerase
MAKWVHRTAALMGAILFLVTSTSLTILVIWSMHQQSRQKTDTSQTTDQTNQSTTGENKLQGTQLKDFTPVAKVDKLQIIDLTAGSGDTVKAGDTVTAHYYGAVASTGVIFESSLDSGQPVTFPLSDVIKGWQEGVPGMKVGGTRRLLIPATEAYGSQSKPGIPANSDLVFDIVLTKIGQ